MNSDSGTESAGNVILTVANSVPFLAGEIVTLDGLQLEIVSIVGHELTLHTATVWRFLLEHMRICWRELRWAGGDAYLELCDIWDNAREDWRNRGI